MHQKPFMHAAVSQDVTDVEDMLMATLDTLPTTPEHHTQDLLTQVSTANQFQSEAEFTQRSQDRTQITQVQKRFPEEDVCV